MGIRNHRNPSVSSFCLRVVFFYDLGLISYPKGNLHWMLHMAWSADDLEIVA